MDEKYFLRDEEIHVAKEDCFGHTDVANNIAKILETNKPPYNIAVIGKWGLGKSSLINIVTNRLESTDKYIKIDINAWKYEKEVLGKVFLRQVSQKLDENMGVDKDKNIFVRGWTFIRRKYARSFLKSFMEQLKSSWLFLLIYALAMFVIYGAYKWVALSSVQEVSVMSLEFLATVFTGYCRNIAVLLFAPMLLTCSTQILGTIRKHITEKAQYCLPEINIEDYEIELQRKIKSIVKNNDDLKIIIVLDDLDRLAAHKMVEALNAIKMFINFPNCIFIVPFDDEVIKKAIETVKNRETKQSVDPVESELLLDKLFQYKVYLAPLLKYDIKNYAVELCMNNMQDFVTKYCGKEIFEKIIRNILIHREVETPRQVKKLVNVFVTNLMIAQDRENAQKVQEGFATTEKGMYIIAKLSVLQADFNAFYDLLFEIPDAMDIVLKAQKKENDGISPYYMPQELKRYFGIQEKSDTFKKEHMPLLNFLTRTTQYNIDSILPYLYVAMEAISVSIGGKKQKEFIDASASGNLVRAEEMFRETPELMEVAILTFQQSDDIDETKNIMKCILQGMKRIKVTERKRVALVIEERVGEIAKSWISFDEEGLNYEGLLRCYGLCDNKNEYQKLLEKLMLSDFAYFTEEKTKAFAKHWRKNGKIESELFDSYIKKLLDRNLMEIDKFVAIKQTYHISSDGWKEQYYKYLIQNIKQLETPSGEVLAELEKTFLQVLRIKGINYCFAEMQPLYSTPYVIAVFRKYLLNDYGIGPQILNELVRQRLVDAVIEKNEFNVLYGCIDGKVEIETAKVLDGYVQAYGEKKDIAEFIVKYAKNNDVNLLQNSLTEVIHWLLEEPSSKKVEYLSSIMRVIDERGREEVLDEVRKACKISKAKSYEYFADIIEILCVYLQEEMVSYITSLSNMLHYEDVNNSYVNFVAACYNKIKDKLTQEDIHTYINVLCDKIERVECVDVSICAIKDFAKNVSEEKFLEMEAILYDAASESNCQYIYEIYITNLKLFTKENENLRHILDVCLLVIENTELKNEAIDILDRQFSSISKVVKLVGLIVNDDRIDKEKAYKAVRKFLGNKDISNATKNVILILKKYGEQIADTILWDEKHNILSRMTNYIVNNTDDILLDRLLLYIEWIIKQEGMYNKDINSLISSAADMCDTDEERDKLVKMMESMKEQYKGCSKMYITPVRTLLKNTENKYLQARLYKIARNLRFTQAVKDLVPEELQK